MIKHSVLGEISRMILQELYNYTRLTGLSFDVLDENMYRVAGTGISNYVDGEKVQDNFSPAEHVTRTRGELFLTDRVRFFCARCDYRDACPYLAEAAYPVFLGERCAGIVCAHCQDAGLVEEIRRSEGYYRDMLEHLVSIITALAEGVADRMNAENYRSAVTWLVRDSDAPVVLVKNRLVTDMSSSAGSYVSSAPAVRQRYPKARRCRC